MPVISTKATPAQRDWLKQYEDMTGFEALNQEELDSGEMSFDEVAQANVGWFEAWSMDTLRAIQKGNPADLEDDAAA